MPEVRKGRERARTRSSRNISGETEAYKVSSLPVSLQLCRVVKAIGQLGLSVSYQTLAHGHLNLFTGVVSILGAPFLVGRTAGRPPSSSSPSSAASVASLLLVVAAAPLSSACCRLLRIQDLRQNEEHQKYGESLCVDHCVVLAFSPKTMESQA